MSGDEIMLLLVCGFATAYAWYRWCTAACVRMLVARNPSRIIFITGPLVCLALLYLILRRWAVYRALALMGLRRNSAGGFGSVILLPGQGGGFG